MFSPITADTVSVDLGNGSTIEYSQDLLEELRRLAVAGYVAFGRGGLEIGGVLYGLREGARLKICHSAEFASDHARGPGFLFSDNDREGFARLLEPPPGLETLGWYRTHTRSGLQLDAGDRELFEQFATKRKSIGLVLKPSHYGPSAATFYMRENGGEIEPREPREFCVSPPERRPQEHIQPEEPHRPATEQSLAISAIPPVAPVRLAFPLGWPRSFAPPKRWPIAICLAAIFVAATALAPRFLSHDPHDLGLQVFAVAPGQLRISWDHNSLPAMQGVSGTVEIRDGDDDTQIPLDAGQLRLSSVTYTQKTRHVEVNLRVERNEPGAAPAEESIEFVGSARDSSAPSVPIALADANPGAPAAPLSQTKVQGDAERHTEAAPAAASRYVRNDPPAQSSVPLRRSFEPPAERKNSVSPVLSLAAPPAVQVTPPQQPALPDLFSKAPIVPRPAPQLKPGPQSGRLIWTGKLGRHEIVEIEGGWSSVGSLSGSLSGIPAEFHIMPAEFTREGLSIYTTNASAHGRTEPPSQSNGWNLVDYEFDPVRVKELVVLEAPNRLNNFKRIVLRSESRSCPVVIVDWTAH